jgi:large subunit ribosomal protein L15
MNLTETLARVKKRPARKRRGRGQGSGLGKTSGRGQKGAKSRSGWKRRYAYEGGQMPLVRRVPKRGFSNAPFRHRYDVVNLGILDAQFEAGSTVQLELLKERGVLKPRHGRLKVLAGGELKKSLTVVAHAMSQSARQKIEAAGGKVELLEPQETKRRTGTGTGTGAGTGKTRPGGDESKKR